MGRADTADSGHSAYRDVPPAARGDAGVTGARRCVTPRKLGRWQHVQRVVGDRGLAVSSILLACVVLCAVVGLAGCGSSMAPDPAGPAAATTGVPQANCAGLASGPGVGPREITIASAADLTGPTPGLYAAAQQAVAAFVGYFNHTSSICGRKLRLLALDSRTDAGGDQAAAARACTEAFAMVGSMSAYDLGGATTVSACGIPDLRAAALHPDRAGSPVVFSARSLRPDEVPAAVPDYFARTQPEAVRHAALVYVNSGAHPANAHSLAAGYAMRGFDWIYRQAVDVAEFNYAPYVMLMKQRGVRYVQFLGSYQRALRLADAMRQQGLRPDAFVLDPTAYDGGFVSAGGEAVRGARVVTDAALFEEAADNQELGLYLRWLAQEVPGAVPSYHGLFAWSAARLFTDLAARLGGTLTRATLLDALAGVTAWDGHGLTVAQDVGGRHSAPCAVVIRLDGGAWVRESGAQPLCGDVVRTGGEG